jgi:hypothetical protein
MGKNLLPMLAGVGLAAATGGLSAGASGALGAAGGTGAAGAGALGAGNALAAQGAAGLLGGAGATAAGYGAPMALGASGGASAMGGLNDSAMATFGPNNEYTGQTIASELTANPYTGGFDNLSGIDRIGQRVSGFLDDGGTDTLSKFKNAFGGQQEQPQKAQNTEISAPVAPQEQAQGDIPNVYGQSAIPLTDEQKRQYLAMQQRGLMYG